jgi:cytidine deaminase
VEVVELIAAAKQVVRPRDTSDGVQLGYVGSALRTVTGKIFTGVSIHAYCGVGFCAEHGAIGAMVTAGEERIEAIVAVGPDGNIMSPCGRCRELIFQVDERNMDTRVVLNEDETVSLSELLPRR